RRVREPEVVRHAREPRQRERVEEEPRGPGQTREGDERQRDGARVREQRGRAPPRRAALDVREEREEDERRDEEDAGLERPGRHAGGGEGGLSEEGRGAGDREHAERRSAQESEAEQRAGNDGEAERELQQRPGRDRPVRNRAGIVSEVRRFAVLTERARHTYERDE